MREQIRSKDGIAQYHHAGSRNTETEVSVYEHTPGDLAAVEYEERYLPNDTTDVRLLSGRLRQLRDQPYSAAVPPMISETSITVPYDVLENIAEVTADLRVYDEQARHIPQPFVQVLLRSESASSSQIENLTAGSKAIAEAVIGERTTGNSVLIVQNTKAMQAAVKLSVNPAIDNIIEMHRTMLEQTDPEIVGHFRTMQVWIGGKIPQVATFVPPHQDRVDEYMQDLVSYMSRKDVPPVIQAAIAHAQFETVHPFPDGNGRTGRAIIHAVLRNRGIASNSVIPISAGILNDTNRYFDALGAYRQGNVRPILETFADASRSAIVNGNWLQSTLGALQAHQLEAIKQVRRDALARKVLNLSFEQPALNTNFVAAHFGTSPQSAISALETLEDKGVLKQEQSKRRNRVWFNKPVLSALDEFASRAKRRSW